LTFDVEKEDIYDAFGRIGKIEDVFIPTRKSFGFVTYYSRHDASDAISEWDGRTFMGRRLICEFAQPRKY